MPGCPTNVDNSRARIYSAFNRCGLGLLRLILRRLLYLFSFSSSDGDGSEKTEIMSQRAVKPKQTSQPLKSTVRHCFNKAIVRPTFFLEKRRKLPDLEHMERVRKHRKTDGLKNNYCYSYISFLC